jgi:competence ComEA-like helix-hairpin-helix protein
MKVWLERYFGFTQKEIRGLCVLIVLVGILMVFPTMLRWIQSDEKGTITAIDEKEIHDFLTSVQGVREQSSDFPISPGVERAIDYFEFNPNELSREEGVRLGLTERQVRMIQNYVAKGGFFSKKEDFKKIYAISQEDYERLFPYISIPKIENNKPAYSINLASDSLKIKPVQDRGEVTKLSIELNSTDSLKLQDLRGIGPVFASRIIRFRDNLGGFHNVSQLLSVYGMDEERFEGIKDYVFVDSLLLKKINVNEADYDLLRKHSLISSKQANAIVHYRKQHGDFATINDLLKIALIDEDFLLKIAPYLIFSE